MPMQLIAYCWRSGWIRVGKSLPYGAIPLFFGTTHHLRRTISGTARRSYYGKKWIVPGVPEANDDDEAMKAVKEYVTWCCDSTSPKVTRTRQSEEGAASCSVLHVVGLGRQGGAT